MCCAMCDCCRLCRFRFQGLGFRVQAQIVVGFRHKSLQGLGTNRCDCCRHCRAVQLIVDNFWFRVYGLGFRFQGLGFRVQGCRAHSRQYLSLSCCTAHCRQFLVQNPTFIYHTIVDNKCGTAHCRQQHIAYHRISMCYKSTMCYSTLSISTNRLSISTNRFLHVVSGSLFNELYAKIGFYLQHIDMR